ncbi:hypothetical protein CKO31_22960 [Thiohalocapsa halophila]|uniref:AAA+ ATPase domain-containing protein n=1 Tax=Thiohalocapsa halophila TaxID=69359 RepID=A0ABS1CNY1_9GAMM|nr:ATP-binding protein [Thiohalocapsa halophila]MBK1633552.1 hypothetical protein [Thiohalocapsa halophila]
MTNQAPAFAFQPATKSTAKLRAALFGPSGSGKTFTALRIATGLGGRVAVIDTERGSASKYADRFGFDVLDLHQPNIERYQAAIAAAGRAGYAVLVIDSLSHGWQELLAEIDRLASAKYKGNTWSAWSEGTPKQRALVDAILAFPGHVIATMRSKTEWSVDGSGPKSKPVRIGLAPEQGKGIEYEFDLLLELSPDHVGQVIKDRTGKFQDVTIDRPGETFGAELAAWLNDGEPPPADPPGAQRPDSRAAVAPAAAPSGAPQPVRRSEASHTNGGNGSQPPQTITEAQHRRLEARINELRLDRERVKGWCKRAFGVEHFPDLQPRQYDRLDEKLEEFSDIADREAAETAQGDDTAPVDPDERAEFWAEYDDAAAAASQTGSGRAAAGQGA